MPVLLDGLGDHAPGGVVVGHVVVAGDSGAAPFADQLDGEVGCLLIGAVAGDRRAEVVDDDAGAMAGQLQRVGSRSEEHTSELQSLMRISYAVFCLTKKINKNILNYKKRIN